MTDTFTYAMGKVGNILMIAMPCVTTLSKNANKFTPKIWKDIATKTSGSVEKSLNLKGEGAKYLNKVATDISDFISASVKDGSPGNHMMDFFTIVTDTTQLVPHIIEDVDSAKGDNEAIKKFQTEPAIASVDLITELTSSFCTKCYS
jgi:hypothetical protein